MTKQPNAQYNLARPDSLAVRVATRVRHQMFECFMSTFAPTAEDEILDVGVTSDQSYESSNYFELLYTHKHRVTAAGIDDARFLEDLYPGVRFRFANALDLPFEDASFDYVHSSAVLEHVGNEVNQRKMIEECLRVARKGAFITTPNRWFPIEFHTQLPLVHWLPKPWFRAFLRGIGQPELALEANLNLATEGEIRRMAAGQRHWRVDVAHARLLGWKSNLILVAKR